MLKNLLRSPLATIGLFVVAAVLIGFGGINAVRAAPSIPSTWFGAQVELDDIDVALTERCGKTEASVSNEDARPVHGKGALLQKELLLADQSIESGDIVIGKKYDEILGVRNTKNSLNNDGGDDGERIIKEYVRVTVYKYWVRIDENGNEVKATDLDPDYINLHFVTDNDDPSSKWSEDDSAHTSERTVLYYADIVNPSESTEPFTDTLSIDSDVLKHDEYKDATFRIEAVVDAVQTHNGSEAMMSAWGNNSMITVGADSEQ